MRPFDDPNILSNDTIVRGISENHLIIDQEGRKVLSSMAFSQTSEENGGMSVIIESLVLQDGISPITFIMKDGEFLGAVSLNVGDIRSLDLQVGHTPLPNNPFHGEV